MKENIRCTEIETPIGKMIAGSTPRGICLLEFDEPERLEKHRTHFLKHKNMETEFGECDLLSDLAKQLTAYFSLELTFFTVPLDLIGSDFQLKVWNELTNIPYGITRTYKQQAIALGNVKSIRAVASANGDNAVSIIIPCHRIIGSGGELTGYGGKLWRKQYLLNLESNQITLF